MAFRDRRPKSRDRTRCVQRGSRRRGTKRTRLGRVPIEIRISVPVWAGRRCSQRTLAIYKRIRCDPNTRRGESGRNVHEILAQVKEELLLELNTRNAASEAPTRLFKEQRDLVAILGRNLKHPTVPREDSLELLQILREPMARTLRRELRGLLDAHGDDDYEALVSELQRFVAHYDLVANGREDPHGSGEKEVDEVELDLVAYLDLV